MNQLTGLSATQLRQAADLKERIEKLQHDLNQVLGVPQQHGNGILSQKKRTMSVAVKAKIAASARERWAKIKETATSAKSVTQFRGKMSATAKARLSAIAKARWRKVRAAGRTAL